MMAISKSVRNWFYATLVLLLLVPALHLYGTQVTAAKIEALSGNFELLAENYALSPDIGLLVYYAQAYISYNDQNFLDKFNEMSTTLIKKELDLINRADKEARKAELKKMVLLTQDYVAYVRGEVAPLIRSGNREDFEALYREQYDLLAMQLLDTSRRLLIEHQSTVAKTAAGEEQLLDKTGFLASVLVLLALGVTALGARHLLYPLSINYSHAQKLLDHTRDAALVIDPRGNITRVNPAWAELMHIPVSAIEAESLNGLHVKYPKTQGLTQPLFNVLLDHKKILNNQVILNEAEEKTFINIDYYPLLDFNKLTGAAMLAHPVEMHKNKQYLFDTIEAERKKISIEIHDWIGRGMSPIIHSLDYILRAHRQIPEEVYADLAKLREHCQNAAMDMRSIMNDIHPYLIDKVGLIQALESYVSNFEQMQGVRVYMFYKERTFNVRKTAEIVIYRIIQEALSNVVKHSSATEVDIYFKVENDILKIEIMDNGRPPENLTAGKGMWGMKERANLIGGDMVYAGDESGFALTLTIPAQPKG
ncbi:histidine kinase [Desulfoscipio sp. XC116]|uniref:sensor histidine kinase n=1 Tax=Desulfoscipio sp. XC116 TaxID=3144975 RepID=UPI00325ABD70